MKMILKSNRIASTALACMMSAVCTLSVMPAVPAAAQEKNLLVLGDSISAGYGLSEGQYGYYDYIAEYAGYSVTNYAVTGSDTTDLVDKIAEKEVQTAIQNAELICITIGANDVLTPAKDYLAQFRLEGESLSDMVKRLEAEGSLTSMIVALTGKLRPYISIAKNNLATIESELRALNSNAEIIIQTIYNPVDSYTTKYEGEDYSEDYENLKAFVGGQLGKINTAIAALETVTTADIYNTFIDSGWVYINTENKDIHPTPTGHALIASVILDLIGCTNHQSTAVFDTLSGISKKHFKDIPRDDYALLMKYCPAAFGDIDANGVIDADDSNMILHHYLNTMMGTPSELTADQIKRAKVYHADSVTADDSGAVLTYYLSNLMGSETSWGDIL